ncbi:MAG: histone deacetylase [Planctomycetota bacterium]|nr:MAG: histone deacetylase [Planctomycetota bacterium]
MSAIRPQTWRRPRSTPESQAQPDATPHEVHVLVPDRSCGPLPSPCIAPTARTIAARAFYPVRRRPLRRFSVVRPPCLSESRGLFARLRAAYTSAMRRLLIAYNDALRQHDTGPSHPERPERLAAVRAGLEWSGLLAESAMDAASPASQDVLTRVHDASYVDAVAAACARGDRLMGGDPDCPICTKSFDVARLAAGLAVDAARRVAAGEALRAFCAVRPPGHHAECDRAMGFCLFNNVALAANVFRDEAGFERVLIFDWDVHHGNGTQHLFEADPHVLFVSMHEHPDHQYPGTGYENETGIGAGQGATLNIPLMPGAGHAEACAAFDDRVAPRIDSFRPQAILISAGFDAHADDPLGHLTWSDETYVWLLRRLIEAADRHADGRIVSVLEGGYDLGVLRRCVGEHVQILHDE